MGRKVVLQQIDNCFYDRDRACFQNIRPKQILQHSFFVNKQVFLACQ